MVERFCILNALVAFFSLSSIATVRCFQLSPPSNILSPTRGTATTTILSMASTEKKKLKKPKQPYEPKWVKKETLADKLGDAEKLGFEGVGLKGTIPVVFKQGNVTKSTMAIPGQPLREAAIAAGQFIKYGCGKGECGTCEAMCNGKWIRPCMADVPQSLPDGEEYTVMVKEVQAKVVSSGKFFSVRSFLFGFWNNLLGIVGFVKYRRNAKKNWDERREYEDLVKQKTLEKKRLKEAAKAAAKKESGTDDSAYKP